MAAPAPSVGRPSLLLLLGAVAVVSIAARTQQPPTATPPAAPAATPAVAGTDSQATAAAPADSMAAADTTVADSAAAMAVTMAAPAPAPTPTPATWPVDPVTGQTLINGIPVVGRAFVMRKTDGLVKVETVDEDRKNEALAPEAPIVATTYTPLPLPNTRRIRTIMVQATLWGMDTKRSAVERRFYRPVQ